MFAQRGYQAYPNATWLDMSQHVIDNNTLYWDDTCGGGVLWLTYKPLVSRYLPKHVCFGKTLTLLSTQKIKNTITNGLHFSANARQYRLTGNETYFDYAVETLNWWLQWGFDPDTGKVYDTITANSTYDTWSGDCALTGYQTWTYNSGAFIYGLVDLYYATNTTGLLNLARSIAYAGIRDFSNTTTGVLVESCEDDPAPDADSQPGCQQDELAFKGVFMMALAELYMARADQNIYNFVNTQLLANVFNNVDNSWLFGEWWAGPWNETTAGPKTQLNALCMLASAAQVNAAHLATLDQSTTVTVTDMIGVPFNSSTDSASQAGNTNHGTASRGDRSVPQLSLGAGAMVATVFAGLLVGSWAVV